MYKKCTAVKNTLVLNIRLDLINQLQNTNRNFAVQMKKQKAHLQLDYFVGKVS